MDIELPRCTLSVARRHFQPEEIAGLELLPHMAQTDALNRIWTAKEAFLKALGRGVTVPLGSFTVTLGETGAVLKQDLSPLPFRLHEYPMDAYRICLCTADDRPQLQQVTAE